MSVTCFSLASSSFDFSERPCRPRGRFRGEAAAGAAPAGFAAAPGLLARKILRPTLGAVAPTAGFSRSTFLPPPPLHRAVLVAAGFFAFAFFAAAVELVGGVVAHGVGFVLGRVAGLADFVAAGFVLAVLAAGGVAVRRVGFALDAALLALHDMRQLVREESVAFL